MKVYPVQYTQFQLEGFKTTQLEAIRATALRRFNELLGSSADLEECEYYEILSGACDDVLSSRR